MPKPLISDVGKACLAVLYQKMGFFWQVPLTDQTIAYQAKKILL